MSILTRVLFRVSVAIAFSAIVWSAELPVDMRLEDGAIVGSLKLSADRKRNEPVVKIEGALRNAGAKALYGVRICIDADTDQGKQSTSEDCFHQISVYQWKPNTKLNVKWFKPFDAPLPRQFSVRLLASSNKPPNTVKLPKGCSAYWTKAVQIMVENSFKPDLLDKDTYTATFSRPPETGLLRSGSDAAWLTLLFRHTEAGEWNRGINWEGLKIDPIMLILKPVDEGCEARLTMTFLAFGRYPGPSNEFEWMPVETNYSLEEKLLKSLRDNREPLGGESVMNGRSRQEQPLVAFKGQEDSSASLDNPLYSPGREPLHTHMSLLEATQNRRIRRVWLETI